MCISKTCVDVLDVFGIGIPSVLIVSMLSAHLILYLVSMLIFSGLPKCDNSLPEYSPGRTQPHWC